MGQKNTSSVKKNNLLEYAEIIKIAPSLEKFLNKETVIEFSNTLYEFTKLIFDKHKDEKKQLND